MLHYVVAGAGTVVAFAPVAAKLDAIKLANRAALLWHKASAINGEARRHACLLARPIVGRWIVNDRAASTITRQLEVRQCVGAVKRQFGYVATAICDREDAIGVTRMCRTVLNVSQVNLVRAGEDTRSSEIKDFAAES